MTDRVQSAHVASPQIGLPGSRSPGRSLSCHPSFSALFIETHRDEAPKSRTVRPRRLFAGEIGEAPTKLGKLVARNRGPGLGHSGDQLLEARAEVIGLGRARAWRRDTDRRVQVLRRRGALEAATSLRVISPSPPTIVFTSSGRFRAAWPARRASGAMCNARFSKGFIEFGRQCQQRQVVGNAGEVDTHSLGDLGVGFASLDARAHEPGEIEEASGHDASGSRQLERRRHGLPEPMTTGTCLRASPLRPREDAWRQRGRGNDRHRPARRTTIGWRMPRRAPSLGRARRAPHLGTRSQGSPESSSRQSIGTRSRGQQDGRRYRAHRVRAKPWQRQTGYRRALSRSGRFQALDSARHSPHRQDRAALPSVCSRASA